MHHVRKSACRECMLEEPGAVPPGGRSATDTPDEHTPDKRRKMTKQKVKHASENGELCSCFELILNFLQKNYISSEEWGAKNKERSTDLLAHRTCIFEIGQVNGGLNVGLNFGMLHLLDHPKSFAGIWHPHMHTHKQHVNAKNEIMQQQQ